MKKIRCLGDSVDGTTEFCYFIHVGDWNDEELKQHQKEHNETWKGFEEIKFA